MLPIRVYCIFLAQLVLVRTCGARTCTVNAARIRCCLVLMRASKSKRTAYLKSLKYSICTSKSNASASATEYSPLPQSKRHMIQYKGSYCKFPPFIESFYCRLIGISLLAPLPGCRSEGPRGDSYGSGKEENGQQPNGRESRGQWGHSRGQRRQATVWIGMSL